MVVVELKFLFKAIGEQLVEKVLVKAVVKATKNVESKTLSLHGEAESLVMQKFSLVYKHTNSIFRLKFKIKPCFRFQFK